MIFRTTKRLSLIVLTLIAMVLANIGATRTALSHPAILQSQEADEDLCLRCHGNKEPIAGSNNSMEAPVLPEKHSMDWLMYEFVSEDRPPKHRIEDPINVLRGKTYYDWERKSMTEVYQDKCIDIFPEGRDYPCQFTSIKEKTYLIKFSTDRTFEPKACCRWRDSEFWAPRPDVLRNMKFDQDWEHDNEQIRWWILDIALPGPFGYGLSMTGDRPKAFWFPVISGWVQQEFYNFRTDEPEAKHFELPPMCLNDAPVCGE